VALLRRFDLPEGTSEETVSSVRARLNDLRREWQNLDDGVRHEIPASCCSQPPVSIPWKCSRGRYVLICDQVSYDGGWKG